MSEMVVESFCSGQDSALQTNVFRYPSRGIAGGALADSLACGQTGVLILRC